MQGSEKQVDWAQSIKADALQKVRLSLRTKELSQEQYDALVVTADSQAQASWWIDRRLDFRNSANAVSILASKTSGYADLPEGQNASIIF